MQCFQLDDAVADDPGIEQLNNDEFRAWIRLLAYAARLASDGDVTELVERKWFCKFISPKYSIVGSLVENGFLEVVPSGETFIYNWEIYKARDPDAE